MRKSESLYAKGVLLTVLGGAGLAEISTSNHGCFWLCATVFAIGFVMILWSYKK